MDRLWRMASPLRYREPNTEDRHARRQRQARQAVYAGALLEGISILLILAPLALGRSSINKYFVAFGAAGVLLAISFVVHGLLDLLRKG